GELTEVDLYARRFPALAERLAARLEAYAETAGQSSPENWSTPAEFPRVPGYEVLSVLGEGGMGVVYKARHLKLQRLVALKMIRGGGCVRPGDLQRLRAEAEAVARLQHPNIVQIYEFGEIDRMPFLTLEYCAGGSLAQKLGGKPMAPAEGARLIEVLAL